MTRKILASVSVLLASTSVALANGSAVNNTSTYNPVVYVDSSDMDYAQGNWNGFYVGAGGGYAWGNFHTYTSVNTLGNTASNKLATKMKDSNLLGIIGYSHTFNRLYLAGELDAGGFLGNSGERTNSAGLAGATGSYTVKTKPTWEITPSVLIGGLLTPQWLVYARVGAPIIGINASQNASLSDGSDSAGTQHSMNDFGGGVLGGVGVGYSFNPHLNLRVEDDYSHIWSPTNSAGFSVDQATVLNTSTSVQEHYNEVLASISYVF